MLPDEIVFIIVAILFNFTCYSLWLVLNLQLVPPVALYLNCLIPALYSFVALSVYGHVFTQNNYWLLYFQARNFLREFLWFYSDVHNFDYFNCNLSSVFGSVSSKGSFCSLIRVKWCFEHFFKNHFFFILNLALKIY